MVKLLMEWDIQPGRESAYLEFVTQTFTPGLSTMGLELSEVWFTYWGDCPQLLIGFVAPAAEEMRRILQKQEWIKLHTELMDYVTNYRQKVVTAQGPFQI